MIERTFSIIKPDAVARNLTGEILAMIQENGLTIKAMKMIRMTPEQAEGFYAVHREKPFFSSLVRYMTSGPVVCSILEGEDAVRRYRELMGAVRTRRKRRRMKWPISSTRWRLWDERVFPGGREKRQPPRSRLHRLRQYGRSGYARPVRA